MKKPLSASLSENLSVLDSMFGASADYYAKPVRLAGMDAAILMLDNLSSVQALWDILLECASRPGIVEGIPEVAPDGAALFDSLMQRTDVPAEPDPIEDFQAVTERLTAGFGLLLIDGAPKALAFSVQSQKYRSVSTPSAEGNIRGSREGFTEPLRVNLSLMRRLIRTEDFVAETAFSETATHTEYAICYCKSKVSKSMLEQIRSRLKEAAPNVLLDSSYFAPWLCPVKYRLFTPLGYTERPSVACAKLCEGKVIILVNGSPSAMIVPYLFAENFECLDDYGGTAYFATILRILKYVSFFLTVMLPGAFVCSAVYTPELIPPSLLYRIASAENATPLPLFAEMLLVILILEIIREAGLRMPDSLGNSVSLVAALIVGDAAVSTGILSTPVILIAAVTSIAMFVTPSLYEPAAVLRAVFLVAGGLAGPVGFAASFLIFIFSLSGPELFGVPYTRMLLPLRRAAWQDGILRKNFRTLSGKKKARREEGK
jgi:spore germination protein KA